MDVILQESFRWAEGSKMYVDCVRRSFVLWQTYTEGERSAREAKSEREKMEGRKGRAHRFLLLPQEAL